MIKEFTLTIDSVEVDAMMMALRDEVERLRADIAKYDWAKKEGSPSQVMLAAHLRTIEKLKVFEGL